MCKLEQENKENKFKQFIWLLKKKIYIYIYIDEINFNKFIGVLENEIK